MVSCVTKLISTSQDDLDLWLQAMVEPEEEEAEDEEDEGTLIGVSFG